MPIEPDNAETWPWELGPALQTYPSHPHLDADSAWVLAKAVSELADIRCPAFGISDFLADLHATVSLLRQGQEFLPATIADARSQDRSWTEIAAQLGTTTATARRRYNPRTLPTRH